MTEIVTVRALASRIGDGDKLALPVDYAGVAMQATDAILAHGPANLHLVAVPTGGLQVDMLIGAGLVATLETSAVSLGEAGAAPCFVRGVREGTFRLMDATCPAIHAGLIAAQKGVPFLPLRGILGSDLMARRPDWKVIDNPFGVDDPIALIPAIRPDVCLFHAPEADRFGNVWIGRRRELATMAYASARTLVTVERVREDSLLADEKTAAGVLPALYVDAVAEAPNGAWPYGLWGAYATDAGELARYARAARTVEGFEAYMTARAGRAA